MSEIAYELEVEVINGKYQLGKEVPEIFYLKGKAKMLWPAPEYLEPGQPVFFEGRRIRVQLLKGGKEDEYKG